MNKKSIHLIKDDEYISCPYCNKTFQFLHWKHLKYHGKSLEDVRNEFPDIGTMTKLEYNKRLIISEKGIIYSKESCNKLKIIKCIYCDNIKEVPNNFPNKFVCEECLLSGKEEIDGRKKEEANIKRNNKNIELYGEDYINKFHKKSMESSIKNSGGVGFQVEEFADKTKQTMIKKYGVDNYMKSKEAMIDYISPAKLPGVAKKISDKLKGIKSKNKGKTYIEILGENKAIEVLNKKKEKILLNFIPQLSKILEYLELKLLDEKYLSAHIQHNWKCLKCKTEFNQIWNKIQQGYLCPSCFPRNQGYSKSEKEISEFINYLDLKIIENSREIIKPHELDIYIPSKNIAIEFDGLYWHSEEHGKDKNYHLNKTELCKSKNIQLIHIFEDEWLFKQDIVKSRLKQILNLNNDLPKIHARKCEIKEILPEIKNEFLEKYHIQGKDNSNIKLGAFYNNELVSVMTFSKGNISKGSKNIEDTWELNRFCSNYNYHIPGIASKLSSYFKNNYNWKEIYSYADRRWSNGNLYYKLGFELSHITKPNYWYIKGFTRIHRFCLCKRPYEPKNISEKILREQEGYICIYDCGYYKFIMKK